MNRRNLVAKNIAGRDITMYSGEISTAVKRKKNDQIKPAVIWMGKNLLIV